MDKQPSIVPWFCLKIRVFAIISPYFTNRRVEKVKERSRLALPRSFNRFQPSYIFSNVEQCPKFEQSMRKFSSQQNSYLYGAKRRNNQANHFRKNYTP